MFQSQANEYGKSVPVPWQAINNFLSSEGAPSIDVNSFGTRYDSEDPSGPLHNIVNGDRDRFSENGIVLIPDNQSPDMVNDQDVIDQDHSEVKKMANHALKSK